MLCFAYSKRWKQNLPELEFAYINYMDDAINVSPFFVEYVQNQLSLREILLTDKSNESRETIWFLKA